MRHVISAVIGSVLISTPTLAAKPPASNANPQVAYVTLGGTKVQLKVADVTGANAQILYTSPTSFRFDLAPRAQQQVAISGRDGKLRLLTYTTNGSGQLSAVGAPVELAPATSGLNVAFSRDGRRIAYACCDGGGPQALMVYDLDTQTATKWADIGFLWDAAFLRTGGTSLVYGDPNQSGGQDLYEITAPGATPKLLYHDRSNFYFSAANENHDAIATEYHDTAGNAFVGLWQVPVGDETQGHFLTPNRTNRSLAFFPELSCDDRKLAYMSSTTPSGGQVFFVKDLVTGQDTTFAKLSNIQLQFWPTCN
jgi:hypothetical protein